ncbi:PREDICTED: protein tilB homolog [Ceratosolen solmsi marchali]|uniref:Protein tilB homolog n=1 Tax=Ceratosolen solmsi marchali TaxID=326594 RepID=A0AAJ7DWS3_9HYME|nr:PREDICTED: protein tilB homolog [Ceratosolen solmsi marchali]
MLFYSTIRYYIIFVRIFGKMPRITMDLLRKRSEHNEGEISTLEEISLHQENIERIELLNQACRNLKILLLQYNLISKIENLHKLKQLEYLNLALNNIEIIENLEGLESLKKLDLTINFIGNLKGVKTLRHNQHLEQLILSGNPCCDYDGYRDYVVATLPQLKELDMVQIERSERIKALQRYAELQDNILRDYWKYADFRETQKSSRVKITEIENQQNKKEENEDDDAKFWSAPSHHTPEDRIAIANKIMKREKQQDNKHFEQQKKKYVPKFFNPEGKPYNINQPKISFLLNDEDDREHITLDVAIYKHLDTSYVDVDVQPNYIRVMIKGKILQLVLPCEVVTDSSIAQRNVITGNLLVIMPRIQKLTKLGSPLISISSKNTNKKNKLSIRAASEVTKRELLEIGPPKNNFKDLLEIVKEKNKLQENLIIKDNDFKDDPNVPLLE